MENCSQEINEDVYSYAIRLLDVWNKEKATAPENAHFRTTEFIAAFFIDTLRDDDVKRQMQKEFKKKGLTV